MEPAESKGKNVNENSGDGLVSLTIRVTEDVFKRLHERFEALGGRRKGVTKQSVGEKFFSHYAERGPVPYFPEKSDLVNQIENKEIQSSDIGPRDRKWHQKLGRILKSRYQKSIQENLNGFCLGLDAMEEVAKLRAALDEREANRPATAAQADDLEGGIKRVGKAARGAGRSAKNLRGSMEGMPEPRKNVPKKKA